MALPPLKTLEPLVPLVAEALRIFTWQARRPGRTTVITPGTDVVWDDCCDGYLYARLLNVVPLQSPNLPPSMSSCAVPNFIVTAAIGVVRCAHTVDDAGEPPTPIEIEDDGVEMVRDMETLQYVLQCVGNLRSILQWLPVGVEGGCHGGEWQFTYLISNAYSPGLIPPDNAVEP